VTKAGAGLGGLSGEGEDCGEVDAERRKDRNKGGQSFLSRTRGSGEAKSFARLSIGGRKEGYLREFIGEVRSGSGSRKELRVGGVIASDLKRGRVV